MLLAAEGSVPAVSCADSSQSVFDRLLSHAVPALISGRHRQDEPPVDGGRWPVSVVGLPDERSRGVLTEVMREAVVHAGPGIAASGRASVGEPHLVVQA